METQNIELEAKARAYAAGLDTPKRRVQLAVKRLIDITAGILGLAALSPLFVFLMVWIRLDSKGRSFFSQMRIGQFGRLFKLLKLRSMQDGCAAELNSDGSTRVVENDGRLTHVGRRIRKWGLDELPQLVNILKGDMSLVGPRPDQDFHAQWYVDGDFRKLAMRPGLTSLGQVSGRNALSWKARTAYEIQYVENFSLWLDLQVLARTLVVVVNGLGAYHSNRVDQVDAIPGAHPDRRSSEFDSTP